MKRKVTTDGHSYLTSERNDVRRAREIMLRNAENNRTSAILNDDNPESADYYKYRTMVFTLLAIGYSMLEESENHLPSDPIYLLLNWGELPENAELDFHKWIADQSFNMNDGFTLRFDPDMGDWIIDDPTH